jgi:Kef-type K+ transport system membrane component KefB
MELTSDSLHASALWAALEQNFEDPIAPLLLQFIVIILATRTLGALFSRLRQPPVIGEIVAGIGLGPSLLGSMWPSAFAFMFPKGS